MHSQNGRKKKPAENLNKKAVWASNTSGIGQFQLEEVFILMDLPAVSQDFQKNRNIVRTGKKYIFDTYYISNSSWLRTVVRRDPAQ